MPTRIEGENEISRFNHLYSFQDRYTFKMVDEHGKSVIYVYADEADDLPAYRIRDGAAGEPWVIFKGSQLRPYALRKASLTRMLHDTIPELLTRRD